MRWHSLERKVGFGIEVQSDDGFWTVRRMPHESDWTLFRNVDHERFWASAPALEAAIDIAEATVAEEKADDLRRQAERGY